MLKQILKIKAYRTEPHFVTSEIGTTGHRFLIGAVKLVPFYPESTSTGNVVLQMNQYVFLQTEGNK